MTSTHVFVGHWSCTSVTGGKTTRYTTDWELIPGGRWLRGINRSGASASEDLETFDAAAQRWRIVDLEPEGAMSVLLSRRGDDARNSVAHSVYPDGSQSVALHMHGDNAYTMNFDFVINGKHALWEDDCTRD